MREKFEEGRTKFDPEADNLTASQTMRANPVVEEYYFVWDPPVLPNRGVKRRLHQLQPAEQRKSQRLAAIAPSESSESTTVSFDVSSSAKN